MSNPLLDPAKFQPAAGPPATWPGGQQPGYPGAPVPPAADNVPGAPWPPPPPQPSGATLRRAGVASATGVLLAIICVTGVVGWNAVTVTTVDQGFNALGERVTSTSVDVPIWIWLSVLAGFGLVVLSAFKPHLARITAPIYAVAEGLFVGAISRVFEVQYDGIVMQAVLATVGVFMMMLALYATGRIRVTPRFRLGVIAATFGIMFMYLVTLVVNLFGGEVPFVYDAGPIGIAISVVVVVVAALNLTLDFDFIDRAEQAGAPRQLEWFAALGLVVTLVWLYIEMLRLLSKIRR